MKTRSYLRGNKKLPKVTLGLKDTVGIRRTKAKLARKEKKHKLNKVSNSKSSSNSLVSSPMVTRRAVKRSIRKSTIVARKKTGFVKKARSPIKNSPIQANKESQFLSDLLDSISKNQKFVIYPNPGSSEVITFTPIKSI